MIHLFAKSRHLLNTGLVLVGFLFLLLFSVGGFLLIRDVDMPLILLLLVAVVWSIGSLGLLYYFLSNLILLLPRRWQSSAVPIVFAGPALVFIAWTLGVPIIRTLLDSFYDSRGEEFIFLENYGEVVTNSNLIISFRNTAFWILIGTPFTLFFGTTIAVLADGRRLERLVKSIIFMPMAISLVGAGIIWSFVYEYRETGVEQIGILNAILVLLGGEPQVWIQGLQPWNNFFLILIVVWIQSGFAMVFTSAALRGVPAELVEAARVDGAGEVRIFFSIQLPYIWSTLLAITSTLVIFNLKIFDIVWALTGGSFGTSVIATEFYRQYFTFNNFGIGNAIAIVLLILVVPVMIYNLRQFRQQNSSGM